MSPNSQPRISIVIPTFNRSALLEKALESALAQTYPNMEIIVSDNASTDGTQAVMARFLEDPRVHYFRNTSNVGMVRNWHLALNQYVSGDFFIILSDDDLLIDTKYLSKAADIIRNHPDVTIVYANGYIYNTIKKTTTTLTLPFRPIESGTFVFSQRDRVPPQDFTLCNILFDTKLAKHVKAFSDPLDLACDSELFLNLCLYGKVGIIQDMVSIYQIHGSNLITSLTSNPDLLMHSFNMYINPYRTALEKQSMTTEEQTAFEEVLGRAIQWRSDILYGLSQDHHHEFRDYIHHNLPHFFDQIAWIPIIQKKSIRARISKEIKRIIKKIHRSHDN